MAEGSTQDQVADGIPQEGSDAELEQLFGGSPEATGTPQQTQAEAGTQGHGDAQASQAQQPVDPKWDQKAWELTYRGQKVYPKDRQHLINLAQQGWSYSQEMAKLNQERQAMQANAQRLSQYEQFDAYLKSNPHVAQAMLQAAQNQYNQQPQAGAQQQAPQVPPELMQKVGTLEQQLQQQQNWHQDQLLDNEIQQLKAKHPNHDWTTDNGTGNLEKQLLQFCLDNNITNLEHGYRIMMWDTAQTQSKADALKGQMASRQQAHQQGVVQRGAQAPAGPAKTGYQEGMSYKDAAAQMIAEMTG